MQGTILLVEDDPEYRALLGRALELQGYCVTHAASGQEALQVMAADMPDLIVSDLQMRGMNGTALCRYIRGHARLRDIPFIVLSAFVDDDTGCEATSLPADRILSKQVSMSDLITIIRDLLNGSRNPPLQTL